MTKDKLKSKVVDIIDKNKKRIAEIADEVYSHPALGYREEYAGKYVADKFGDLGLEVERNIAVTGCRAQANGRSQGPSIAVLGELDAVMCKDHPDAGDDGSVHACGHSNQIAVMMGTAIGLVASEAIKQLDGTVNFFAVPAEEYIELEYRSGLIEKGKIKYFGGKQELIHKGYFDDIDISMMMHSINLPGNKKALIGAKGNGFVGKKVRFIGKESHAGAAPDKGINALNAAMLAINNINALRETFPESEKIRVHPIITKGGDIVNVVPADVRMETYVRGRTINGILDANKKVNNSLRAGALAVGAGVEIVEMPGYLPLLNNDQLDSIFKRNIMEFVPQEDIVEGEDFSGSTDFGDLAHIMPGLHPFIGGIEGDLHTRDFKIKDPELAYLIPAKAMAMTIIDLLYDGAQTAYNIKDSYEPRMTKEEYLDFMGEMSKVIHE